MVTQAKGNRRKALGFRGKRKCQNPNVAVSTFHKQQQLLFSFTFLPQVSET